LRSAKHISKRAAVAKGNAVITVCANQYKLVLIEWEDSQLGYQGWKIINDEPIEMPKYVSVGFLIYDDEKCKVLYPHVKNTEGKEDISGSGDIKIPNSAILRMVELELN
jgi:hypothetical protein